MRKSYPLLLACVLGLLFLGSDCQAQRAQIAAREAEWNSYSLPSADFVRGVARSGAAVFRVPAGWQREEPKSDTQQSRYRFTGPHSSLLQISIEKIPDGWPLRDYLAAIMQQLRTLSADPDRLTVRRTEISGLEAREIMFDFADQGGTPTRRLIWCAVDGPTAIGVVLIAPERHAAELEPYFRAVVESLIVVDKEKYDAFEALRSASITESKPSRIDEVQSIVTRLNGLDPAARGVTLGNLAAIFSSAPDRAIDLVLDRRPLVRASAIEAIARSKNHALDPFLVKALHDPESFVSAPAARAVAQMPNVVELLRDESLDWFKITPLARAWPFLDKNSRLTILDEGFGFTKPAPAPRGATATAIVDKPIPPDPSRQLGLLTLLKDIPVSDFKLPLAQLLASKNDVVTATGLQMALDRHESLPAAELLKLLSSTSQEVQRLAAANLGESAAAADIPQMEDAAKRISAPSKESVVPAGGNAVSNSAAGELRIAVRKIRLREQLNGVPEEKRQPALKLALSDPDLAHWAWAGFVAATSPANTSGGKQASATPISPLAENAFPEAVLHYVSIPNPGKTFQKFGDSLNGIQMDSARAQANLVLVLTGLHERLGQRLGAPADRSVFEYSGINLNAPISFAVWSARGAPPGLGLAIRKAVILHVADRDRFERTLALYQKEIGSFAWLPESVSVSARLLAALPAVLPLTAEMMLKDAPKEKKESPVLAYDVIGQAELDGQAVKIIAERSVSPQGLVTNDVAYLMYVGGAAVLTPDLESLGDILRRTREGGPTLAANAEFKHAKETGGDAIYLSSVDALFRAPGRNEGPRVDEFGALTLSNTSWESSLHLSFKESAWSKPLISFQPDQLVAPRELLPRSTVAYYFMKLDLPTVWHDWSKEIFGQNRGEAKGFTSVWAIDFEKELLPEIDGECGVALLGLPDVTAKDWHLPWVAFFKLKREKLEQTLNQGHLFKDATRLQGLTRIKTGSGELFVLIKRGFLVVSDRESSLAALDQTERLNTSRDFAKAARRAPAAVVAFGGYNLEGIGKSRSASSDSVRAQQADLILSLTRAFHSPNLYAAAGAGNIDVQSSISMDREGRYSIAELQSLAANTEPAFAVLEPTGLPIANQDRLKSLKIRIHTKAAGEVERIAEDVAGNSQIIEERSDRELQVRVLPRRAEPKQPIQLPVTGSEFAPFLESTNEMRADEKTVSDKAREIAGTDRDAWSVARKLADWTYKNLKWKRVDQADAAQTLATREADCYEFSKLYVAMARSLGLPARIVSGLAYSGSSFGGHAWVEVYAGAWYEIDPTWGTDFIDATHVRDSTGALLTYGGLNLIQLEVLEAPRGVEDFQLDPTSLTKKLCVELPQGQTDALSASLDIGVLTDELMGQGTWLSLTDAERDQVSAAYQRVSAQLPPWLSVGEESSLRLLTLKTSGDRAEAFLMIDLPVHETFLKLNLVRHEGAWLITEVSEVDSGLNFMTEYLRPSIKSILDRRKGQKLASATSSDLVQVLMALNRDPKTAVATADQALKNGSDRRLRYLKALALDDIEKTEEAVRLWTELSEEKPPLAPAVLSLAYHYGRSKEEADWKKAVELYTRYFTLEPEDPRAHAGAADLYDALGDYSHAETEYRAAIDRDSSNADQYLTLAEFYARRKRLADATTTLDEATLRTSTKDDLFAQLIFKFLEDDQSDIPEALAAAQPQRMAQSAIANLNLAVIRITHEHPREALPLLKKAAALDPKAASPYDSMAHAYRKLKEWKAALNAADTAIQLSTDDAEGHYERACALARLGRKAEAMVSLKRAIELDATMADSIEDEEDLKSLASLAEFKKIIAERDKK